MKVAIIGAGVSGLSCAIELERHGIYPVIFERNDFIGEYYPHVSAYLGLITRPVPDAIKYINKKLRIELKPLNTLNKVIHYSPNNEVTVTGDLGYFMVRSQAEDSVKNQLFKQIKSPVKFNSFVTPEELENEFDYVVVADGHWTTPKRYGIWQEVMSTWVKGAVFEGDFEENTLKMWLDRDVTNGVYIYLAPFSKTRAVISHIVQNIDHDQLNDYWNKFLDSRDILKQYNMVESWEQPHHAGYVTTNRVGKVYFAGLAGGGAEPFLGFGQFNAIFTGVMIARSIKRGKDINLLLKDINKKTQELITLRGSMNVATNNDYDKILTIIKTPGLRSLIYGTDIDIVKNLSKSINLFKDENRNQT